MNDINFILLYGLFHSGKSYILDGLNNAITDIFCKPGFSYRFPAVYKKQSLKELGIDSDIDFNVFGDKLIPIKQLVKEFNYNKLLLKMDLYTNEDLKNLNEFSNSVTKYMNYKYIKYFLFRDLRVSWILTRKNIPEVKYGLDGFIERNRILFENLKECNDIKLICFEELIEKPNKYFNGLIPKHKKFNQFLTTLDIENKYIKLIQRGEYKDIFKELKILENECGDILEYFGYGNFELKDIMKGLDYGCYCSNTCTT